MTASVASRLPTKPVFVAATEHRPSLIIAWTLLVGTALVSALLHISGFAISWHYFVTGAQALSSAHPLSLYATHPELQFGPLTSVVAWPIVHFFAGPWRVLVAMGVMVVLGLLTVGEIRRALRPRSRRAHLCWFLASAAATVAWSEVAVHYGHLDDAIALYLVFVAFRLTKNGHWITASICIGLAIDAKPWAVPLAALLLAGPVHGWVKRLVIVGGIVAAAWLPFLIADPATLNLFHFTIPVEHAAPLHVLDPAAHTTPPWCRALQFGVGGAFAFLAVRRGRPEWAVVAVFAARLLFDPSVHTYYGVELVLAAALVDIVARRFAWPWFTTSAFLVVYAPHYLLTHALGIRAWSSLIYLSGVLALVLVASVLVRTGRSGRASLTIRDRLSGDRSELLGTR